MTKIRYLAEAKRDLAWFRKYYGDVFPEGRQNASSQFLRALKLLSDNPHIGHPIGPAGARELTVARTPFSLIYRVSEGRIDLMRVWDNRADRTGSEVFEV